MRGWHTPGQGHVVTCTDGEDGTHLGQGHVVTGTDGEDDTHLVQDTWRGWHRVSGVTQAEAGC